MISPTQRPLPKNTQHSQETDIYAPAGFEPIIPASKGPQTHALDRVATGIGYEVIAGMENSYGRQVVDMFTVAYISFKYFITPA